MANSDWDKKSSGVQQTPQATKEKPKQPSKLMPQKQPPKMMPQWKVLLHNDDKNEMDYVVKAIMDLTHLNEKDATARMKEAHKTGIALILVTHKERAELYKDQFYTKSLTVTIEPAE